VKYRIKQIGEKFYPEYRDSFWLYVLGWFPIYERLNGKRRVVFKENFNDAQKVIEKFRSANEARTIIHGIK